MNPLYIIIDISGSMKENGKYHIVQLLIRYIRECHRLSFLEFPFSGIQFGFWIEDIFWEAIEPLEPFFDYDVFDTSCSLEVLAKWINKDKPKNVLILSDGHFSQDEIEIFRYQIQKGSTFRCISIGCDANTKNLQAISSEKHCFDSSEIDAALHLPFWLQR